MTKNEIKRRNRSQGANGVGHRFMDNCFCVNCERDRPAILAAREAEEAAREAAKIVA